VWALNAVWGSSPEDIWAVGQRGTLVHWDGVDWNKERNTVIDSTYTLWDIWGFDENNVFVGANKQGEDVILYKYNGTNWEVFLRRFTPAVSYASVWGTHQNNIYFFDYRKFQIGNGVEKEITLPNQSSTIYKIRGSGNNNIFTSGAFGEVFHFNGSQWKKYEKLYSYPSSRLLQGIWSNQSEVFMVGISSGTGAVIIKGKIKGKENEKNIKYCINNSSYSKCCFFTNNT
jgi:hypothetical protein